MICRLEDIKELSGILLSAVDSSEASMLTDMLELKVNNKILYLSITNKEYFTQVKLPLYDDIDFHAAVNAGVFLKLISKLTSETVEFTIKDRSLCIKGNGSYSLPLIYDGNDLLELPEITITNITNNFNINSDILKSIVKYNSKEFVKGFVSNPVQTMYYIDGQGCITFTTGACVNNFKLEQDVKLVLSQKLVKLFKLFNDNQAVKFKLGHDVDGNITQTKAIFETDKLTIATILLNSDLVSSVPADTIRQVAEHDYAYNVMVNTKEFTDAINRLLLFISSDIARYNHIKCKFKSDCLIISDMDDVNSEVINFIDGTTISAEYEAVFHISDIKASLECCGGDYAILKFGDSKAIVISKDNIKSVSPEVIL